jgi:hypothetical protein
MIGRGLCVGRFGLRGGCRGRGRGGNRLGLRLRAGHRISVLGIGRRGEGGRRRGAYEACCEAHCFEESLVRSDAFSSCISSGEELRWRMFGSRSRGMSSRCADGDGLDIDLGQQYSLRQFSELVRSFRHNQ